LILAGVVPYLNHNDYGYTNGTVRFDSENLDAYAWFDTSGTHVYPHWTVIYDIQRLLQEELPRVTQGKLNLQYFEGDESPELGVPLLHMYIDASVPGSGNNATSSTNGELDYCLAKWPSSLMPSTNNLFIEILQAVGDLPDIGGNPPVIHNPGTGWEINDFGESTFSLLYFVNPNTFFDD